MSWCKVLCTEQVLALSVTAFSSRLVSSTSSHAHWSCYTGRQPRPPFAAQRKPRPALGQQPPPPRKRYSPTYTHHASIPFVLPLSLSSKVPMCLHRCPMVPARVCPLSRRLLTHMRRKRPWMRLDAPALVSCTPHVASLATPPSSDHACRTDCEMVGFDPWYLGQCHGNHKDQEVGNLTIIS